MAKPADNLREAVERTVDATVGSAGRSRSVAQGALEDLRRSVSGAIEGRRPATSDDVRELKAELRAIGRRLDAIEKSLPKKRSSSKRASSPKRASSSKRTPSSKRAS